MQLKEHVLYGGTASCALYPVYGTRVVWFFLGSILIDADHYIDFLYFTRFKDWNVRKMFRYHQRIGEWKERPNLCALEAFHTAEFLLILLALSLYFHSPEIFLIFSGMIFHLILDLVRLKQWGQIHMRALSFTEYWIRSRRMKQLGVDPERVFEEAYETVQDNNRT